MASFIAEIKRRKVFQVAVAYAIVAWLLIQVVIAIKAPLQLPVWFDTAVIVLLLIGFPITLIMEGSVRYAGHRVRVTAQLVAGSTGTRRRESGTPRDRCRHVQPHEPEAELHGRSRARAARVRRGTCEAQG